MKNHIGIREIGSIQGDGSETTGSITSSCGTCRWENSRRRYDMDGWRAQAYWAQFDRHLSEVVVVI